MAVDDDIDALEIELEGLDGEDSDDRLAKIKRLLPILLPIAVLVVFVPVVFFAFSGGDDDEPIVTTVQELGPIAGTAIKINPESDGAPVGDGVTNPAYDTLNQGSDDTKVDTITPPPEAPVDMATANTGVVPPPDAPPMEGSDATSNAVVMPDTDAPAPAEAAKAGDDGKAAPESLMTTPAETATKMEGEKQTKPEVAEKPDTKTSEPDTKTSEPETAVAQVGTKLLAPTVKKGATTAPSNSGATTTEFRTMAGVYRVQVASAKSENQARNEWKSQVSRFPDVLSNLSLTVQTAIVKDRGTFFRVQGGPFTDRDSADSVCRKLKSKGQDCLVVRP